MSAVISNRSRAVTVPCVEDPALCSVNFDKHSCACRFISCAQGGVLHSTQVLICHTHPPQRQQREGAQARRNHSPLLAARRARNSASAPASACASAQVCSAAS